MRLIRYIPSNQSPLIFMNCDRVPIGDIYISPSSYKDRREMTEKRFEGMLEYSENQERCRSVFFEEYFGVESSGDCGVCDICLERKRTSKEQPQELKAMILELLGKEKLSIAQIIKQLDRSPQSIAKAIEELLDNSQIEYQQSGRYIKR